MKMKYIWLSALVSVATVNADNLSEKSLLELMTTEVESKVEVGSRNGSRDFLNSIVPIDVVTQKQIEDSGLKDLTQILARFIPGFNAPSPAIKDGSDHVKAFTLRGLNPDQVLVLINGKRLHASALIHVNDTIGRGTSGVNLNTIPVVSIDHVEVLRDGAAAQYGSDAIAGVINIILKSAGQTSLVSSKVGLNIEGDGNIYQADLFHSTDLDYDGYINISAEVKTQEVTDRSGIDSRQQYEFGEAGNTHTTRLGQAENVNYLLGFNSLSSQDNDLDIYTHTILNYQDGDNNAYFRRPIDDRNDLAVYPDGFLPNINTKTLDYSITAGVTQKLSNDVSWDLSQTIGYNEIEFFVSNSFNDTLGVSSPKSFENGGMDNFQAVSNLDIKKTINDLKVAVGLEYKYEKFGINAGENASYTGSENAGSQGFPGFRPENEVDASRNNFSAYIDINYNITPKFLLAAAARFEDYSDFDATLNYKLALSYKINNDLLLRASGSTGFKAPSLAQSHFTSSSTTLVNGTLSSTGTLTPDHEISQALGASELQAEESIHFTTGFVYKQNSNFSTSIDYFYTQIDDRIMLSTDIAKSSQSVEIQELYTRYNVTQARYFTNAVITTTQGIDLRVNYQYLLSSGADVNLNASYSYARTKIDSFNGATTGLESSILEKNRIEDAQAKDNFKFHVNYELSPLNIAVNVNRYGEFKDVFDSKVHTFSPQWTLDMDMAYQLNKQVKVAIGGTNIFDTYPDKWGATGSDVTGADSMVPYSQYSPSGYNGAFYYVRVNYEF